jgi:DNA-3-methyladenine glycosylase
MDACMWCAFDSAKGRTARTETMFHDGGHAYVYLIYGMYHCLNIVSENVDVPEAVLIRALQPIEGIETMQKGRKARRRKDRDATLPSSLSSKSKPMKEIDLCSGPGKLCQAFHV